MSRPLFWSEVPLVIADWTFKFVGLSHRGSRPEIRMLEIEEAVRSCEANFDVDYSYDKEGLLVFHEGRRGLTISLWHWGAWGSTKELFYFGQFFPNGQVNADEVLSRSDPVASTHEVGALVAYLSDHKDI